MNVFWNKLKGWFKPNARLLILSGQVMVRRAEYKLEQAQNSDTNYV